MSEGFHSRDVLHPFVSNIGGIVYGELPGTGEYREVLQLIAEGQSTTQVALKLHISAKTVETHRRQIMNKLDMHTVAELTKYAIRKGLTALET